MKNKYQSAKTIKDYTLNCNGWEITVPKGSTVENKTASGNDNNYRFWVGWSAQIEKLTGHKNSILAHDLTYYGLNIPAEFCEPYKNSY